MRPRSLTLTVVALATLAALGGCSGATPAPPTSDGPPRLLVLSALIGYVEPCGCTLDLLLGGVDRAAALVAAERAQGPTAVLVVGSTFFEGPSPAHRVAQDEAKAELLARALGHMGVDAVALGPADLARGGAQAAALLARTGAPDVTANVPGGQGALRPLGPIQLGVFGLADPAHPVPAGAPTDPVPAARAEAARLRAAGAHVVVALANLPRRDLRLLAREVTGVDLWILGDHPSEAANLSPEGEGAFVVEAGDRGRHLARLVLHGARRPGPLTDPRGDAARRARSLDLQIQMKGRMAKITRDPVLDAQLQVARAELAALEAAPVLIPPQTRVVEHTLVALPDGAAREPTVRAWMGEYNARLKALNLAAAGAPLPVSPGGSRFVGDAECAACHPEAAQVYKATRHAKAWATLEAADKTFDAECVSCHVVGFQQPGGTALGHLTGFTNVQCENCHGPGERHVAEGGAPEHIARDVPVTVCQTCHNAHHSPSFDDARYRPKILGPGHGRPLASAPR